MNDRIILLNLGELILKGGNRAFFERRLLQNIQLAFKGLPVNIRPRYGRMLLEAEDSVFFDDMDQVHDRLKRLYGIVRYSLAVGIGRSYEDVEKYLLADLESKDVKNFVVRVKRADKNYPMTSIALERQLGAAIVKKFGWPVKLKGAEYTVSIVITEDGVWYEQSSFAGAGGLPVGTSGKMLSLLSSGIDSPVASARMSKRGATVHYLHFHSYPMTTKASIENARMIVERLQEYQPEAKLILAPLLDLQKVVVASAPPQLRIILYRRAMYQIADIFAHRLRAQALITGESLGQVASQTTKNMTATADGLKRPLFRPLIGMDKQEIIHEAELLGTFDISIRPYEDCCSLLTPKSVETHAHLEEVRTAEAALPWKELIDAVIEKSEIVKIG